MCLGDDVLNLMDIKNVYLGLWNVKKRQALPNLAISKGKEIYT